MHLMRAHHPCRLMKLGVKLHAKNKHIRNRLKFDDADKNKNFPLTQRIATLAKLRKETQTLMIILRNFWKRKRWHIENDRPLPLDLDQPFRLEKIEANIVTQTRLKGNKRVMVIEISCVLEMKT